MKILARLVIVAFFILALSKSGIIPGISVESFATAIVVAVILGIINVLIKPVLVLLTLPLSVITLGLFIFVINAFLFWLTSILVSGFYVDGFISALLGAVLMSVLHWLIDKIL